MSPPDLRICVVCVSSLITEMVRHIDNSTSVTAFWWGLNNTEATLGMGVFHGREGLYEDLLANKYIIGSILFLEYQVVLIITLLILRGRQMSSVILDKSSGFTTNISNKKNFCCSVLLV